MKHFDYFTFFLVGLFPCVFVHVLYVFVPVPDLIVPHPGLQWEHHLDQVELHQDLLTSAVNIQAFQRFNIIVLPPSRLFNHLN